MIRKLGAALWALAQALPYEPERDPDLGPFHTYLRQRYGQDPLTLTYEEWAEALLDLIAERIAEGWDRYGAPSAARTPQGPYLASAESPQGPLTVTAESKREAYRRARREWVRRLLG